MTNMIIAVEETNLACLIRKLLFGQGGLVGNNGAESREHGAGNGDERWGLVVGLSFCST